MIITRTIVYFDDELFGLLLDEEDYRALGGPSMVEGFRKHHVQLVRAPDGGYSAVDDVNGGCWMFVDDVNIEVPTRKYPRKRLRWRILPNQNDEVSSALKDITTVWSFDSTGKPVPSVSSE